MIFITGPLFAGKRDFACHILGCKAEELVRYAVWDVQNLVGQKSPEELAEQLETWPVVIATEVGGGVVPVDTKQRADREAAGRLACGDVGKGKMPEPEDLLQHVLRHLALPHDLSGKRILVTAGPTQESLDPVRYLTNHSTGKMGYAIARMAMLRGAEVTLISGPTSIAPPPFVTVVPVVSAQDMFEAVAAHSPACDWVIKAAAVADYTPADYSDDKVKKKDGDLSIPLKRTQDILQYLGDHKQPGQFLCGFSMETRDMLENSRAKLEKKHVDMICANNLKVAGAGFAVDTNVLTLITADGVEELPLLSKEEAACRILDAIRIRSGN